MGCRQIGGDQWGDVSEEHALETLHAANEAGITFYDTANIYGLGRSESLVAKFIDSVGRTDLFLATKLGRWPDPGLSGNIAAAAIRKHTEASLARLKVDALNLTQLHCAPETLLEDGQVFETLRALQSEGKIRRWDASVESTAAAKLCLAQPGMASLQVIFIIFRQTPLFALLKV